MTSFWLYVLLLSVTEVVIVCSYYSNCSFADLQDLDKREHFSFAYYHKLVPSNEYKFQNLY